MSATYIGPLVTYPGVCHIVEIHDGDRASVVIGGNIVEGVITVEKDNAFLCQNKQAGTLCKDLKGFKYSWQLTTQLLSYDYHSFKLFSTPYISWEQFVRV